MNIRKITVFILTITISAAAFTVPFIKAATFVFAEDQNTIVSDQDSQNQFASNFIVYCANAGVKINGNGVTPWIMDKVDNFCSSTGRSTQEFINTVNNKAGLVADQTGVYEFGNEAWTLLNGLYDYIYQDDDINNNRGDVIGVASTKSFTPSDGKTYYLYIKDPNSDIILGHGTPLRSFGYFHNNINTNGFFPYTMVVPTYSDTRSYAVNKYSNDRIWCSTAGSYNTNSTWLYDSTTSRIILGTFCYYVESNATDYVYIGLIQNDSRYAYYTVRKLNQLGNTQVNNNTISLDISENVKSPVQLDYDEPESGSVNVYNVNYNTYNDIVNNSSNITIINNNPSDPEIPYNPYPDGGGSTTGPSSGNGGGGTDGTITLPDLDLTLPEINWSLGDLSEKFPFSIPFDLIAFFTVLNSDPEAPAIDAEIPLGDWYTWHFEADFSQFDNYAVLIRNVEFIAFCVGLIYLTIKFVKG